jgi:Glycosyl hydrolase family 115/Gylcosyl hydrolase family 115 C-terminal domain
MPTSLHPGAVFCIDCWPGFFVATAAMKQHCESAMNTSAQTALHQFLPIWRRHFACVLLGFAGFLPGARLAVAAPGWEILLAPSAGADCVTIIGGKSNAVILVDPKDFPVVGLAANFFADDVQRVTGHRPAVTNTPAGAPQMIIVGTLGHSAFIDQLAAGGKLKDLDEIQGHWETTLSQIVEKPFPGVECALVIAGSDRRGAAYGLMQLSEKIGVSPWYWWADVPVRHRDAVTIKLSAPETDAPGVKYRGIFINDEDWGLNPWAAKTFDPAFNNIGPKTYAKVFELMLRLRLNYLWPAMHAVTTEFGSVPENVALADQYAIVAGASHCEPMLYNNVHWDEKTKGRWNYALNRDGIHAIWDDTVKARGTAEAVWTLGIRGIHDIGMEQPPSDLPGKIALMSEIFRDQRELLDRHVTKQWGDVAQCFVPYKEVLPIYDAGLKVPEDVTLVWVDDNFGYIRRLGSTAERMRSGGTGVYWHISYYGSPHSYTWINTTPPALMWEELHKAWENEARAIWVLNVGDIKPMEIGIDYYSQLAWNPGGFSLGGQPAFLRAFAAENIDEKSAPQIADFLMEFYRLGSVRKAELMDREWALALPAGRAAELETAYRNLLQQEETLAAALPGEARDAFTELAGFPAQVQGLTGLIFLADRKVQLGADAAAGESEIARLRGELEAQVVRFNTQIAGGKWNRMMPGLETGKDLTAWNSQVRWPWGEKPSQQVPSATNSPIWENPPTGQGWRDAATVSRQSGSPTARWSVIEGLGPSGRAMALQPASLETGWEPGDENAPALEFDFTARAGDAEAFVDFLPTFRLCPGMKLRVSVNVDNQPPMLLEVPGSSGAESETGAVRRFAVQDNYARALVPLPNLKAGKHTFKIRAVDPGAVIDRVSLP